jgi:hypothetical protein
MYICRKCKGIEFDKMALFVNTFLLLFIKFVTLYSADLFHYLFKNGIIETIQVNEGPKTFFEGRMLDGFALAYAANRNVL